LVLLSVTHSELPIKKTKLNRPNYWQASEGNRAVLQVVEYHQRLPHKFHGVADGGFYDVGCGEHHESGRGVVEELF
jgi:hypothetical protein